MLTTGFQLAAARALIGMDQADLADRAGFSVTTIRNMEKAGGGPIAGRSANVQAVQRALEATGVEFLNHGYPGVRLRWPLIMPLRAVALHVATFADVTAWDSSQRPSRQEEIQRENEIKSISVEIEKLADASRSRKIRPEEFDFLKSRLSALGSFATDEQLQAIAVAFSYQ